MADISESLQEEMRGFRHWDRDEALKTMGDDPEILREIVAICLADFSPQLRLLGEAVASKDAAAVENLAHKLKGGLSMLSAGEAFAAALALERAAMDQSFEEFRPRFAEVSARVEQLLPELSGLFAEELAVTSR